MVIDWGMRYGNPSTASKIKDLQDQGCQRILLFPLYPQYSAATTGTACDQAFRALMKTRWQPAIRTVPAYHDEPGYIEALAQSIETHLAKLEWTPDVLVTSFHGVPKRYLLAGDPYHCQCQKTARLLRERLGWDEEKLQIAFQSSLAKRNGFVLTRLSMSPIWHGRVRRTLQSSHPVFPQTASKLSKRLRRRFVKRLKKPAASASATFPVSMPRTITSPFWLNIIERELGGWVSPNSQHADLAAE